VRRGTPLQVLKELGGWGTLEMVQRYAHPSADHLARWVQPHTQVVDLQTAASWTVFSPYWRESMTQKNR
jgi:hypothetical protein